MSTQDTKQTLSRFKAGHLGLEYRGRPLLSTPRNVPLDDCAHRLRNGKPFTVVLEPGDATRYTFALLPLAESGVQHFGYDRDQLTSAVLVVREHRGHLVGVVANWHWDFAHHEVGPLAAGNEHTGRVFVAFLSGLFAMAREG